MKNNARPQQNDCSEGHNNMKNGIAVLSRHIHGQLTYSFDWSVLWCTMLVDEVVYEQKQQCYRDIHTG